MVSSDNDHTDEQFSQRPFEKRHGHVLRDITLQIEAGGLPNSGDTWFREVFSANEQNGQEYRSFDLTRDGLILLVMGWTGPNAAEFRKK